MCRVMLDLDDVIYPWSATAHAICEKAGITGGNKITQWEFWRDYGCDPDDVWTVLNHHTREGGLYDVPPYDDALPALTRLTDAGCGIHLVTARGFQGPDRTLIRQLTCDWLAAWDVPHDSLTFSRDKRVVPTDYFVDDSLKNYDQLDEAGVCVYLLARSHNNASGDRRRVGTLDEFVDEVLR